VKVTNNSRLSMESDAETYRIHMDLEVFENDEKKWSREWDRTIPRKLQ